MRWQSITSRSAGFAVLTTHGSPAVNEWAELVKNGRSLWKMGGACEKWAELESRVVNYPSRLRWCKMALMQISLVPGFATKCFGQENSSSLLQRLTSLIEKASWNPREALKWSTVWGCLYQKKVITRCVKNFSEPGNLDKNKSKGRPVTATDENNVATAKQIIEGNRQICLKLLSQQLDISSKSAHTILRNYQCLHIKADLPEVAWRWLWTSRCILRVFLQKHADNSNFNQTLIMSDEAHFELNGCVNKQNIRRRKPEGDNRNFASSRKSHSVEWNPWA